MADRTRTPATPVEELLSAYIDGRATEEERRQAEALLATDQAAARALAELRYAVRLLGETPPIPLPRAFTLSEQQAKPVAAKRRPWPGWLTPGSLRGAAALVAICLIVLVVGDPGLRYQLLPVAATPAAEVGEAQVEDEKTYSAKGSEAQLEAEVAAEVVTTSSFLGLAPGALHGLRVAMALLLIALLVVSIQLQRMT